jgi:hypothetical protein
MDRSGVHPGRGPSPATPLASRPVGRDMVKLALGGSGAFDFGPDRRLYIQSGPNLFLFLRRIRITLPGPSFFSDAALAGPLLGLKLDERTHRVATLATSTAGWARAPGLPARRTRECFRRDHVACGTGEGRITKRFVDFRHLLGILP